MIIISVTPASATPRSSLLARCMLGVHHNSTAAIVSADSATPPSARWAWSASRGCESVSQAPPGGSAGPRSFAQTWGSVALSLQKSRRQIHVRGHGVKRMCGGSTKRMRPRHQALSPRTARCWSSRSSYASRTGCRSASGTTPRRMAKPSLRKAAWSTPPHVTPPSMAS